MRRYLLISIIGLLAIVIIGGGVILLVDRTPALQNAINGEKNNSIINTAIVTNTANTNTKPNTDKADVLLVARVFTERYGTGSSDDAFAGYLAAVPYATTALGNQLEANVRAQKPATDVNYRGFVTHVVSLTIDQASSTVATVRVGTQRTETIATTAKQYNQSITLLVVKESTGWKVSSAQWQAL